MADPYRRRANTDRAIAGPTDLDEPGIPPRSLIEVVERGEHIFDRTIDDGYDLELVHVATSMRSRANSSTARYARGAPKALRRASQRRAACRIARPAPAADGAGLTRSERPRGRR